MRIGFVGFSSAPMLGCNPNPIAPPARAEILTKLRLVVDLMCKCSMIVVFALRN